METRRKCASLGLAAALASPVAAQVTERVSLSASGESANSYCSQASISADGRYVAFSSYATNLVPNDTNGTYDIYVRDLQVHGTERVSLGSSGQGNGDHGQPSISADGRYVALISTSTNLVSGDTNGTVDIFVRDRLLGVTERVSVDSSGAEGNGESWTPSISPDGRYVAFHSFATNLVLGDTNGMVDVFVRDRQLGVTERVSVDSSGAEANEPSSGVSISADGRYVTFYSSASNLVGGDTNQSVDVFVRDRQLGVTERVSVDSAGGQAIGGDGPFQPVLQASISPDGRFVAFLSFAHNLVSGDTNGKLDIFVRDRQLGLTERVSIDSAEAQANNHSYFPSISASGRHVAFRSAASNLVSGDTNGMWDIYVRDRLQGRTERVSVASSGADPNWPSDDPSISADGRYVAFYSDATNLVPGDPNGSGIFVRDRHGDPDFTSLCDPGFSGVIACPCANPPGVPGQGCDNSAGTGGAILMAAGSTHLSTDSLVFTTSGERPSARSIVVQGSALLSAGTVFGQGVRCAGGSLERLYTKTAVGGSITAPDFSAGDPPVSERSAALGSTILPGQSRWYFVYYRDPVVLGGCPASSVFNATQTGQVVWQP
jgi:Tol biopolymer transport system component